MLVRKKCILKQNFPGFKEFNNRLNNVTGLNILVSTYDSDKAVISNDLFKNDIEIEIVSDTEVFLYMSGFDSYLSQAVFKVLNEYGYEGGDKSKISTKKWIEMSWIDKLKIKYFK